MPCLPSTLLARSTFVLLHTTRSPPPIMLAVVKSTAQLRPLHTPAVGRLPHVLDQTRLQPSACNFATIPHFRSPILAKDPHLRFPAFFASDDRAFVSSRSSDDRGDLSTNKHLEIPSADKPSTSEMCYDESKAEVTPPLMYHDSSFLDIAFLDQGKEGSENSFALIVLNYDMPLLTLLLWRRACLRVCADGGANRIYDSIPHLLPYDDPTEVRERYKPDVIMGDLDSIRSEVKEYYDGLGTKILEDSDDQDTTDLQKCISYIKDTIVSTKNGNVKLIVLGAFGGRLDHTFANINVLYMFPNVRIVLLSDESMAFLLPRNINHEVLINPSIEGPQCGLLPLGGSSISTTTSGLKWNLDKASMQFGGLISTSNIQSNDIVTVHSDTDLVWTISLQKLNDQIKQYMASCKVNRIP